MSRLDAPAALAADNARGGQKKVEHFAREIQLAEGGLARNRGGFQDDAFEKLGGIKPDASSSQVRREAYDQLERAKRVKSTLDTAQSNLARGQWRLNQINKLGVDLATCTNSLKYQCQLQPTAIRRVANRNCMELGGVWIDEAFTAKTAALSIRAQSEAYFRILERQPQMKEVFQLGNHVVWVAPNGTGLVIDTTDGKERISDQEIEMLFAKR